MGRLIIIVHPYWSFYRMKMQCSQPLEIVHPTLQMIEVVHPTLQMMFHPTLQMIVSQTEFLACSG